ncbi:MAG: hypothetical protein ACJAZ0_000936 [Halioglobus sp.]|jgi:hypothetical protein
MPLKAFLRVFAAHNGQAQYTILAGLDTLSSMQTNIWILGEFAGAQQHQLVSLAWNSLTRVFEDIDVQIKNTKKCVNIFVVLN